MEDGQSRLSFCFPQRKALILNHFKACLVKAGLSVIHLISSCQELTSLMLVLE